MQRIIAFTLIRLLALAWVLYLASAMAMVGPYAISLICIVSEAVFGYLWGRAQSELMMCKPRHMNPWKASFLISGVFVVEGAFIVGLVGPYFAHWVLLWRSITAYAPFLIVQIVTFSSRCKKH